LLLLSRSNTQLYDVPAYAATVHHGIVRIYLTNP